MNISEQLAKHFRDIHFGGNWTFSCLQENLADVTWEQATTQVHSFNTILMLVYHVNYFVVALINVLQGEPLTAKDKFSFNHPPIRSKDDWEKFLNQVWIDAEKAALLIEKLPVTKLSETFVDEKYGTYFRNINGTIEHMHYHLGQIVLIKKLLLQVNNRAQ